MFLQSGLGYRFRYSRGYIQHDLDYQKSLINRHGYIVHADTREKSPYDTIVEFLPIREVTIKEVRDLGAFVWIYFELGDWIFFSEDNQEPNEYHPVIFDHTPVQSRDALTLTLYESSNLRLKTIDDDPSGKRVDVIQNWGRIVKHMARFEAHKERKATYLKLLSLKMTECENHATPKALSSDTERGYELKSDADYRIEVFQYSPHELPEAPDAPFPLTLVVDEKRIVPLVKESTIWGKYDLLLMSLRPKATMRDYRTLLRFEPKQEDKDMKLTVTIPVRILKGWRRLLGALSVAGATTLVALANLIPEESFGARAMLACTAFVLAFLGLFYGVNR
jgi:hypothetical protein